MKTIPHSWRHKSVHSGSVTGVIPECQKGGPTPGTVPMLQTQHLNRFPLNWSLGAARPFPCGWMAGSPCCRDNSVGRLQAGGGGDRISPVLAKGSGYI